MEFRNYWVKLAVYIALIFFGIGISAASTPSYEYFLLNPNITSGNLTIISLSEANKITSGSTVLSLEKYETGQIPVGTDLDQGTKISGTGPFTLGSDVDATDLPVPAIYAGTNFVIPHYRDTHTYYLMSPHGSATATVTVGSETTTVPLTEQVVVAFSAGPDNGLSGIVQSDRPILVSHVAGAPSIADAFPVPPVSKEVWGVRSSVVVVGALEDATTINVYSSDGFNNTFELAAGASQEITTGDSSLQGLGAAVHIVADKPVAAIQLEDGDGSEATAFLGRQHLGTRYGVPVSTRYITVVCTDSNTTVTLVDGASTPEQQFCNGSSTNPGKAYFDGAPSGAGYTAGVYLESNHPIQITYDTTLQADEHNISGHKDSYLILNPDAGDMNVVSLVHNNQISTGSTTLTLDEFELGVLPALLQGVEISGTGPFTLGGEVDTTDMPVPGVFAGTRFVIPHYRDTHTYYLLSPYDGTNATIKIAGVETSVELQKGQVFTFNAGSTNLISGIVQSETPILVSHRAGIYDAYPVPPASLEAWGVKSTLAFIGALENDTEVNVITSDGSVATYSLNAGAVFSIPVGSNADQGQGVALHLLSNKPIAAIQVGDADGGEATAFFDTPYLGTRYAVPVEADYIAVVCTATTMIRLRDGFNTIEEQACTSDGATPGKAYFDKAASEESYSAGTFLESSEPIYIIYDTAILGDEHNLLGFNIARKSTPPTSIVGAGGYTRTSAYNVTGTAGADDTINIYINGVFNQSVAANSQGNYSADIAALNEGQNYIYTTVANPDGEGDSQWSDVLSVHYIPEGKVEYYVVDPDTAANEVTVYSQVDGNVIRAGANQYALNKGETATIAATDIEQGDVIWGDFAFSTGSFSNGGKSVSSSLLGKTFVMPHLATTSVQRYYIFNPSLVSNAMVAVTMGEDGSSSNVTVLPGEVKTVTGSSGKFSDVLVSNSDVAVSYHNTYTVAGFAYSAIPATTEVWGIRSQNVAVGSQYDGTTIIVEASDGTSESFVLDAGGRKGVGVGNGTTQGQGTSLRIYSTDPDKPIAAVQTNDGDGYAATSFWPSSLHATDYTIPVDTQYVAIVCSHPDTTIDLVDSVTGSAPSETCNGSSTVPGKVYLGASTGTNISAGSTIQASKPVYLYYELSGLVKDERNLSGFILSVAPPASPSITAAEGITRTNDGTYAVSGSAGVNETVNIYINGVINQSIPTDETGAYNLLLTLNEGKNLIYTTASDFAGESQPSATVAINYIPAGKVEYYVVNPDSAINEVTIYSQLKANVIRVGLNQYTLDKGETITIPAANIEQGDIIWGDKAFSVGSFSEGSNLVPQALIGTSFAMPHFQTSDHQYYIYSPESDASITVKLGSAAPFNVSVPRGEVVLVEAGNNKDISGVVTSDVPVAISYHSLYSGGSFSYSVAPATDEVWGIKSYFYTYVGVLHDGTTVVLEASDGSTQTYNLNAGAKIRGTVGESNNGQGQGTSMRISANKPIAAVQANDGDGAAAVSFWPSSLHATDYTIPVDTQYVAIACNQPNTLVRLIDSVTGDVTSETCNGSSTTPGKAYLGTSTGTNINAGSTVQASSPIYLHYEVAGTVQDEHNLLGFNISLQGDVGGITLKANSSVNVSADITVGANQTFTINEGAELYFDNNAGLTVDGNASLIINGTASNPVVFTSNAVTPAESDWDGIYIEQGAANVVFDHAVIEYATIGLFFHNSSGMVSNSTLQNNWTAILSHDLNATPSINSSVIKGNNVGLSVTGTAASGGNSNPVIMGNQIFDNSTMNYISSSFYDAANTTLNATGNWWGSADPAVIAQKIYDHSDAPDDSATVDFSGFLTTAP